MGDSTIEELIDHSYEDLRTMYLSHATDADVDSLFGLVIDIADEDLYRLSKAMGLGVPAPGYNGVWIGLVDINVIRTILAALQCDLFGRALVLSRRTDIFKCLVVTGSVSAFATPALADLDWSELAPHATRVRAPQTPDYDELFSRADFVIQT